jgi:EAL domain-containing protein (putative c-di-GMP-specific phosphodiesterase class I)
MELVRGIDRDHVKRSIVAGIVTVCRNLSIRLIAEGIETEEELLCLKELGIDLLQGFLLARPAFETLPTITREHA